jgi:NAD(P)-dependent dehydrogenase (short-subunit alcohol dehydrogenase family)
MRLKGKAAIVTGGARGIGLEITKALSREGAKVAICDVNAEGAKAAASSVTEQEGARAIGVAVNVADPASVKQMIEAVLKEFGRIDILVNNAGVGGNTPFLDTTLEEWNRIIGINLTGAFLVAQAVSREMAKSGGGKIVNIVSLSGQRGGNGRAAYGSAKAGLELLTKVMAVELAPHNINVNNIAPGAIETEMAKYAHDTATRSAYNYLIPMARYGTPEEIADAAVFLCSDEARYVHGHTLNVDGGFRAAGLMFGLVHLEQRHVVAASDVDQQSACARHAGIRQQRIADRRIGGADRAIFAFGLARAHDGLAHLRHHGADIGEVEVHQAGRHHQVRDAAHAHVQDVIGDLEGLLPRGAFIRHAKKALVRDDDQRVDAFLQLFDARLRGARPAAAFEAERLGDDPHGKDVPLPG